MLLILGILCTIIFIIYAKYALKDEFYVPFSYFLNHGMTGILLFSWWLDLLAYYKTVQYISLLETFASKEPR
jgi:hypothetical protein